MRVLYASDDLGPHDRRLLKALAASPHEIHLLTFCNRLPALPDWLARECPAVRVHHRRFPAFPEVPSRGGRLWTALARRRDERRYHAAFREALRTLKPDLVHAGWVQTTGYAAAKAGAHPLFLMPWGSDILVWPEHSASDRRKARVALQAADAVACDAEVVKARIVALAGLDPARIPVFPWGVDLLAFRPPDRSSDLRARMGWLRRPVVVMTRQMRPPYGVLEFAQAFHRVRARVPGAALLLVGDGIQRPEIEAALAPLGEGWRLSGEVDNDVLGEYLGAADVYVSNSATDGSSVSLLEAMACGLPVAATDLPANREWIRDGENGFLVPVGDAEALAERTARLLADPPLAKAMGARNLAIARERADWSVNARRMLACYDQAVAASRGTRPPA